jgi:beta-N-acetylglucosaminidase
MIYSTKVEMSNKIVELTGENISLKMQSTVKQIAINNVENEKQELLNRIDIVTKEKQDLLVKIENVEKEKQPKALEATKMIETKKVEVLKSSSINKISSKTDLKKNNEITAEQMNAIIDYWNNRCGGTPFKGQGHVFIQASKETGYDPIYILAHAALESGWGKTKLATNKYNYFGINAVDSNPNLAYSMGNSLEAGIVEGAKWINTKYYERGYTSLYDMIYTAPAPYASARDSWINNIVSIMNSSYKIIL